MTGASRFDGKKTAFVGRGCLGLIWSIPALAKGCFLLSGTPALRFLTANTLGSTSPWLQTPGDRQGRDSRSSRKSSGWQFAFLSVPPWQPLDVAQVLLCPYLGPDTLFAPTSCTDLPRHSLETQQPEELQIVVWVWGWKQLFFLFFFFFSAADQERV